MLTKYFNSVIEQTYNQIGKTQKNIVLASYNNDFSVSYLDKERYSKDGSNVFFAWMELEYDREVNAFAPFIDVICDMHRQLVGGDFSTFMEECGVYSLHQPVLKSYYETGHCQRNEMVFPDEVKYERLRMVEGLVALLIRLSEIKPIFMVINRFNLAPKSSFYLVVELAKKDAKNIGIVLGANDKMDESLMDILLNNNQVYHMGSSGREKESKALTYQTEQERYEIIYRNMVNSYLLLDYDHVAYTMVQLERRLHEENIEISPIWKWKLYDIYAQSAILNQNYSKALELVVNIKKLKIEGREKEVQYTYAYLLAYCYMYLGRLSDGGEKADRAIELAKELGDQFLLFKAELVKMQMEMSGWHNIFFCVNDVDISPLLISQAEEYGFYNTLAHIYIYAFDNNPSVVAKTFKSESLLTNYSKGVELAKKLGNEELVSSAYQKNVMIASTNGMNEIALLYTVKIYHFLRENNYFDKARCYVGIGYNLSAMGHNSMAENYYNRALELFYENRRAEDIAEVNYNMALNYIMMGDYERAENSLKATMKSVERMHLNSVRVCNLSKIYGLLALTAILQGHRFDCEKNLRYCRQFLNYLIEKGKRIEEGQIIYDYAQSDDDMFLYSFASALLCAYDEEYLEAGEFFNEAENFFHRAEGNQFYVHECYRRARMDLFETIGRMDLYVNEEASLGQHLRIISDVYENISLSMLDDLKKDIVVGPCTISDKEFNQLLKDAGTEKDYLSSKKQLDFMMTWQSYMEPKQGVIEELASDAILSFLTYFNNDRALFIRYEDDGPKVLFNNTGIIFYEKMLWDIHDSMADNPNGFVVSKISENFAEHKNDIKYFGVDEVCSLVAIPLYSNGRIQCVFITYVLMKDNWHNSVNRYMLNGDDLNFYRLLVKELNSAINLYHVNKMIEKSAMYDMLTGVYNRVGMYKEAGRLEAKAQKGENKGISVMFMDVDNFKPYNDTFGHDVGDMVLKEMARLFKNIVGQRGFVSRYGGDEFIIILNTDDRQELSELAQSILDGIRDSKIFEEAKQGRQMASLSCSVGITTNQGDLKVTVDEMIKKADDLMYKVKSGSKGTYTFL